MIGHPREELLLAFQDHGLDDRRRRRMAGHLSGCQRCRNVVQAHRTVRGVFALEAPFAPDGVLERALASRATGTIVLLPVAEPDPIRRVPLPSRGFLIAAGVLVMFGVGMQVLPMTRLNQVWGAWSAMVVEWEPFAWQGLLDPRYPTPPVAKGAAIDPARIRAVRARYGWNNLSDRTPTSKSTITMELTKLADGWQLQSSWGGRYELSAQLDSTLAPIAWGVISYWGNNDQHESHRQFTIVGDSVREVYRTKLGAGGVMPRYEREPYDSTWPMGSNRRGAPDAIGHAHLMALFAGISVRRGWVGSVNHWFSPRYRSRAWDPPTTFMAIGEDTIRTPGGRFDTWELKALHVGPVPYQRLWIAKDNGLVVKMTYGDRSGIEILLESVTYP